MEIVKEKSKSGQKVMKKTKAPCRIMFLAGKRNAQSPPFCRLHAARSHGPLSKQMGQSRQK